MTEKEMKSREYAKELFDRLKRSASFKQEEECFGLCLKSSLWWVIETPDPSIDDLRTAVFNSCTYLKKAHHKRQHSCIDALARLLKEAAKEKRLKKFNCAEGLRGFAFPVFQADTLYGYIGACYHNDTVPDYVLNIFAAFTDTIVKEIQKELELAKLYETIRPRAIALSTVHTVHRLISSTLDLGELLPRIARLCLQVMRANRCSIKLVDAKKKVLLPKATIDLRKMKTRLKKVKVGRHAPGRAVKYGKSIRGDAFLATPLIDEDIIGVITLYDKIDGKPFTQFDQEIMTTLAEQAVIAIKNAQLYAEQEKITIGSIRSLAAILDTRTPGTYMARASLLRIAMLVGQGMRMSSSELKSLEYAVILHDAGQIVVPDQILEKPDKLTGREYAVVKEHPMRSVEIIKHMKALKSVIPIILHHHEQFDGSGYPKGLKGNQIPLGARIMGVIGALEAMITKRPYRVPMDIEGAIAELKANAGSQFDPKVVDVFLKVMRRKDVYAALKKEIYAKH